MIRKFLSLLTVFFFCSIAAFSQTEPVKSKADFDVTVASVKKMLARSDMKVFSEIDHAAAAKDQGLHLNPTLLLIFGNPAVGTDLMKYDPSLAIDLPLKVIVYQDESKRVWIQAQDFRGMKDKGGKETVEILNRMEKMLHKLVLEAASAEN